MSDLRRARYTNHQPFSPGLLGLGQQRPLLRRARRARYQIQKYHFVNPFTGFNVTDNEGRNGFLRAIRSGYGGATKTLLQYLIQHSDKFEPGFLHARDRDGNNAFHQAIYR